MPRNSSNANEPNYTPDEERERVHDLMHELGAHGILVITVYPNPHGTRISTIISHAVPEQAYTQLMQCFLHAFESAKEHVQNFIRGARGTQPIDVKVNEDAPLTPTPKKPNKLVH